MQKVMVLGASPNKHRFSNSCVKSLMRYGYEVVPVGIREGEIAGKPIQLNRPQIKDVDTITIYLNAKHQEDYYDYIFNLRPRRIIFNPGAENPELMEKARKKDIEAVENCTLIMLNSGDF